MFARSSLPARWALWLAVCALLLKAAVPMLASVSAQAQGKTLVEVCTVYGVATVAADADDANSQPKPHTATVHASDQCSLTALAVLAPFDASLAAIPASRAAAVLPISLAAPSAHDRCAAWGARLKHGPPAFG